MSTNLAGCFAAYRVYGTGCATNWAPYCENPTAGLSSEYHILEWLF
ncbi:hypothetical protein M5D96_004929 [Drosophila gunungcola]|uniref:Uncharacterized protein n=1 Tax=Drosophila gunungcola TaxID=103775 RepID=A0A9Q0BTI0_9MUSC|nr:hypothetical protein M5D96_004929 [Drosophila gunungcola]